MNKRKNIFLLICIILAIFFGGSQVFYKVQKNRITEELVKYLANASNVNRLIEQINLMQVDDRENSIFKDEWDLAERGETTDFFGRLDGSQVYFCIVQKNRIPEELVKYLTNALNENRLIEYIDQIQADYRIVQKTEKVRFDVGEDERGMGLRLYYPEIKDDIWYYVSLSDEGDDVIVEHIGEDGCIVNYFFWNVKKWYEYTDVPLRAGGQRNSKPYFVTWEDTNYMVIPYWNVKGDDIIGVTVYKIDHNYSGDVTAIGRNSDGSIGIIPQSYDIVTNLRNLSEGATIWPTVVSY